MSKLRPFMGPSRSEKKANRPPGRLEQEENRLRAAIVDCDSKIPMSPLERLQVEIALAQYKRQGEMIRHLQEIEGRAHRGR